MSQPRKVGEQAKRGTATFSPPQQPLGVRRNATPLGEQRGDPQTPCVGAATPEQVPVLQEKSDHKRPRAQVQSAVPDTDARLEWLNRRRDVINLKRECSSITADVDLLFHQVILSTLRIPGSRRHWRKLSMLSLVLPQ
jgi:hypothetical protein